MFNDYSIQSINKQLLLTKTTSEIIIKHLMNDFDNHARETIFKVTVEVILRIMSSMINKAIDQLNNKEILIEIRQLKQLIMRIKKNVIIIKHFINTIIMNNRQSLMRM